MVDDLGPLWFFSYYNLVEITISRLVHDISPRLFEHCHCLKIVNFEKSSLLNQIGEFAYSNTRIEKIDLPKSTRIIRKSEFSFNKHLKEVSFDGEIIEKDALMETGITEFK